MRKIMLCFMVPVLLLSGLFARADEDGITAEWEAKYGDQRFWDYQINAAFADQETWRYAWNPSMRPVLPDDNAISPEEAVKLSCQYLPQYEIGLSKQRLYGLTCIVSSYRKPDSDAEIFWSKNGTWVIDFWDTSGKEPQSVCTFCLDALTGAPLALLLASGSYYIGAPDNAEWITGTEG